MTYLEEFRLASRSRDFSKILQLWEEYVSAESLDEVEELIEILQTIKTSDLAKPFGPYVEAIVPLLPSIQNKTQHQRALALVFDLETTNAPELAHLAIEYLKNNFGTSSLFTEKLRLVGLRGSETFQGAINNFILLNHFEKGNFVIHTAGWGVGEILDVSFLREQVVIEFEYIAGKKELAFKNGFKTLLPIEKTHFFARRFANPDTLEKEATENPLQFIRHLLTDLGPKTASEIKEEICELVIPEAAFAKWWQNTRSKIKKDTSIASPEHAKEPFRLLSGHATWEDLIEKAFQGKHSVASVLNAAHTLIRDFPEVIKEEAAKARIIEKVMHLKEKGKLNESDELQVTLFLEHTLNATIDEETLKKNIAALQNIEEVLEKIDLLAIKKRLLGLVQQVRKNWADIFLDLLFIISPNQMRDMIIKELMPAGHEEALKNKLLDLTVHPTKWPEALLWYFHKIENDDAPYFGNTKEKYRFFEALLTLLAYFDVNNIERQTAKKIYSLLTSNRFLVVRTFLKDSPLVFAEECLVLFSKCQSFSDHDKKILHSLVEVAHESLASGKRSEVSYQVIWMTEKGFKDLQERIKHIGTKDIVDVAREIEAARSHGDLRENAEYKAAIERRNRLQSELKMLSEQLKEARILTKDDISTEAVQVGTTVTVLTTKGNKASYTILGPREADPDQFILSFQSKLAQALIGKKMGENASFKGEEYKILQIESAL